MHPVPHKKGDFTLDLGNKNFEQRIINARFQQPLDSYSTLQVMIAIRPNDSTSLLRHPPQNVELTWSDKGIFKGQLLSWDLLAPSRLKLLYVDKLFSSSKHMGNALIKQTTLGDYLSKTAETCGLRAQFCGDFSMPMAAFGQAGLPLLEGLSGLADKYGFFFATRSASDQLAFVRAGSFADSHQLDSSELLTSSDLRQSTHGCYEKVCLRYFDSRTMQASDTVLSSQEIYQPLSRFTNAQFQEKSSWHTATGTINVLATDRIHFNAGHNLLAGRLSKQAMTQDALWAVCFKPVALPGDKITLTHSAMQMADGDYLMGDCQIELSAAVPRMTFTAIRP